MKNINVLSLFDGMSCGQIALKELGVKINKYYASEVDKFAINQTQLNFPETIQLGDVSYWREWDINWKSIDLVIGGFCCQSFSSAGNQKGFKDDRGELFFDFADIVENVMKNNPDAKFLGENVKMSKEHQAVIDERLGVRPVEINSSLVSAQNRVRLYWTNIKTKKIGLFGETYSDIPQPKDRKLYLRDILENPVDKKYYLSDKMIKGLSNRPKGFDTFNPVHLDYKGKSRTLLASLYKMAANDNYIVDQKNINSVNQIANIVESKGYSNPQRGRIYGVNGKSPTLNTCAGGGLEPKIPTKTGRIRRLTPTECARLQTIPNWYKWECSDTQQYRMLGNGWTVEVIKHIFKYLYE